MGLLLGSGLRLRFTVRIRVTVRVKVLQNRLFFNIITSIEVYICVVISSLGSGVMLRALSSVEKGGIHQLDDDIERLIYS